MGSRAPEIMIQANLSLSITTFIPCCHVPSRFPDIRASFPIPDYTVLQWPPNIPSSKSRVKTNFQVQTQTYSHATKSKNHPHLHRNNIGWIEGPVIFVCFQLPKFHQVVNCITCDLVMRESKTSKMVLRY
jgi:hypothetical protein